MTTDHLPATAPSVHQHLPPIRIALFGMECIFTGAVLDTLRDAPGVTLAAIVTPGDPAPTDAADDGCSALLVANRTGIADPAFRDALAATAPDLVVVACFPWRLPEWLREMPRHGSLNIHPSLLPDGRGPDPMFWAFRWGLPETGVTIHRLDAGFDTGPIVAQRRVAIPDDATLPSLERRLASVGAGMLLKMLPSIRDGSAAAVPQAAGGRYAPMPHPADLVAPTSWAVSHAARFIHAVTPVYGVATVLVEGTGQRLAVDAVTSVDDGATMPGAVQIDGSEARIRFAPGVLTVRLAVSPQSLRLIPGAGATGSVRRPGT